MSVDPSITVASIGDSFSVNITVSSVTDLAGWEFKLYYLSSRLNGTNIVEGPFLKEAGSTYFATINFTDNYNSTHGLAWVACALLGAPLGVSGNGVLARITFEARQLGALSLSFADTWLTDSQPIPHTALDGIVQILPHDVAITNFRISRTLVGEGLAVMMQIDVENQGNFTETFNVTVYANTQAIATQTDVTLSEGTSQIITLNWSTVSFAKGDYTISAYVTKVVGETDTTDNILHFPVQLRVTIQGDVDGSFDVDIFDLVKITSHYGETPPPIWPLPPTDVNGDGRITILDVVICTSHYGQKYPKILQFLSAG